MNFKANGPKLAKHLYPFSIAYTATLAIYILLQVLSVFAVFAVLISNAVVIFQVSMRLIHALTKLICDLLILT